MAAPKSAALTEDYSYSGHMAMMNSASVEKKRLPDQEADRLRFKIEEKRGIIQSMTILRPLGENNYLVIKIPGELVQRIISTAQNLPKERKEDYFSNYLSGASDAIYDEHMRLGGKPGRFEFELPAPSTPMVPIRSLIIGRRDVPWGTATVPVPIETPGQEAGRAQPQITPQAQGQENAPGQKKVPTPPAEKVKAPRESIRQPQNPPREIPPTPPQVPKQKEQPTGPRPPAQFTLPGGLKAEDILVIAPGDNPTYVKKGGDGSTQKPYETFLGPHKGASGTPGGREVVLLMNFPGFEHVYLRVHATASQLTKKNRDEGDLTTNIERQLHYVVKETLRKHETSPVTMPLGTVATELEEAIITACNDEKNTALKSYLDRENKNYKPKK